MNKNPQNESLEKYFKMVEEAMNYAKTKIDSKTNNTKVIDKERESK